MSKDEKTGLAALLALKAVCCGGLLVALGGASLASTISMLAVNGWVQAGGAAFAALIVGWWFARRHATKDCPSDTAPHTRHTSAERSIRGAEYRILGLGS